MDYEVLVIDSAMKKSESKIVMTENNTIAEILIVITVRYREQGSEVYGCRENE